MSFKLGINYCGIYEGINDIAKGNSSEYAYLFKDSNWLIYKKQSI